MKPFDHPYRWLAFLAPVAVMALAEITPVQGGTIYTYVTPANASNSGLPISAKAVITLDTNEVTLALTNTLSTEIRSIAEALTGITVTYGGGQTPTSIISSSGEVVFVGSSGAITIESPNPQTVSAKGEWKLSGTSLSVFSGGSPNYSLLDTERPGYGNANNSITGNGPHNPYTDGTITFNLDVPNMTSSTAIKSVIFQFGTIQDPPVDSPGNPVNNPIPEPTSILLWSVLGLAGFGRRRVRKTATAARAREATS